MMKFFGALLLLMVAAVAAVWFYFDTIAKTGIERGTSYATGVPTAVDSVSLGLLSGKFGVSGLKVGNPSGYAAPHFFALRKVRVEMPVNLDTLSRDTIRVPLIEFDGIDLYVEKGKSGANYDAILKNLQRLGASSKSADTGAAPASKNLIIEQLVIKDIAAHLNVTTLPGESGKFDVNIPEIRLSNISSKDGGGVVISELTSIVTNAVLRAVMENGIGLPTELIGDLRGELARLGKIDFMSSGALTGRGGKVVGEFAESLRSGDGAIGDKAKEVGEKLKGDFLGNLLGGKKSSGEAGRNEPPGAP